MPIDENELKLLNELLNQMDDMDDEKKTSVINSYIIADQASRTIALMMIKDRLEQIKDKKKEVLHI